MYKIYKIKEDKLVPSSDGNMFFFVNLTAEEKTFLITEFEIDEHTLNSSTDPDELARMEQEPKHYAFIIKAPKHHKAKEGLLFRVQSIGMFLFPDKLIVVSQDPLWDLLETKPFQRVASIRDVFFKIIYSFIVQFNTHLHTINKMSEELENKLHIAQENKYLLLLFSLEKSLVYYNNAITTNNFLLEKIKFNATKIGLTTQEFELLEDILIENNQCLRQAETYASILASLMDARASIIANNLNVLMKILNIITITIMVPTFIVSLFSMNVRIPLSEQDQAFWIILSLSILSAIAFIIIWNKKLSKWR